MDNKYNLDDHIFLLIDQKEELINEIHYLSSKLESKKDRLKTIKSFLKENCRHNYIQDFVSSGIDDIQAIEYCEYCEELRD